MKKLFNKLVLFMVTAILLTTCFFGCGDTPSTPPNTGETNIVEIKNVIVIIGDGMGYEQIEAGELYEGKNYAFKSWNKASVNTDSYGGALTDSAAGGTAIATGFVTYNGYVGKNPNGDDLETVLDVAKKRNKSTAVITTDKLYGATPASFSAHSLSRNNKNEIIESQIKTSNVDILCGTESGTCSGYSSLIAEYGYEYCDDFSKIDQNLSKDKHYWLFDLDGTDATVELYEVVEKALTVLERDEDGFAMMIEQAYIDKYCHDKDISGTVQSVKSLNDTVELVMRWVGNRKDTAVLITADHETGGLTVYDQETSGSSTFKTLNNGTVHYRYFKTDHTKTQVGLFVYGATPQFSSYITYQSNLVIKNIETSQIIKKLVLSQAV